MSKDHGGSDRGTEARIGRARAAFICNHIAMYEVVSTISLKVTLPYIEILVNN